ncbi:MAG TPA: hypothetical protein VHO48_02955, partial [Anaerolineaceae bacterium]|nr:hypothetical protein [Anaerolineaceae bacterium]
MESLSDKLKSLEVVVGAEKLARPTKRAGYSIGETIPGQAVNTPYGETYLVENLYPLDYQHGIIHFHPQLNLHALTAWGRVPQLAGSDFSNF